MRKKSKVLELWGNLKQTRNNIQAAVSALTCRQMSLLSETCITLQTSVTQLETAIVTQIDGLRQDLKLSQQFPARIGDDFLKQGDPKPRQGSTDDFSSSSTVHNLGGLGGSWALSIPKVLDGGDPVWRFVNYGTVPQLADIQGRKVVAPCDMNQDRKSRLHFAVEYRRLDMCQYLLQGGANKHFQDDTPAMMAIEVAIPSSTPPGRREQLEKLGRLFNDDSSVQTMDSSPLGHENEGKFLASLIDLFRFMDVQDALGRTPLIWAAALNRPRTVKLLLEHMADVSRVDKHNKTALHWAMVPQATEVAELLLNASASLEARDCFGRTPLHEVAKVSGSTELINLLIKHSALIDARDDIHERTPLHLAANHGRVDNVLALLANGADIDALTLPSYRTPLLFAIAYNRLASVDVLLEKGANAAISDVEKKSVLHLAALYGSTGIIKTLARTMSGMAKTDQNSPDPDQLDCKGHTAEEYFPDDRKLFYHGEEMDMREEKAVFEELLQLARAI